MKNRSIILTAILSLLGCAGLSCTALAAGPPASPVSVVNTPNVNVANTSPIPVTGTVTAAGTSNVNVVNTATNPVPIIGTVQTAENPARNSVQQAIGISLTPPSTAGFASVNIPPGKIFVLEFASFLASVPGGTVESIAIGVGGPLIAGSAQVVAHLLAIPPPTAAGFIIGSQALRLYAHSGAPLGVAFSITGSDPDSHPNLSMSLSGYFVNE